MCGGACQITGGTCTTSTDCCAGLPCTNGLCGEPQGCSTFGQTCDATNPCCTNLTCVDGTCTEFIP